MKVINLLKPVELHPRNCLLIACNYMYAYWRELIDKEIHTGGNRKVLYIIFQIIFQTRVYDDNTAIVSSRFLRYC